jgi:hypothetical protein
MIPLRQVRARFDAQRVIVYQAYAPAIADAAVAAQRFVPPFSLGRMTWVKPSFLWMMERCGWATKPGQERVLAVHVARADFEGWLAAAALTHAGDEGSEAWREALDRAPTRVQWDPERDLRGTRLAHRSLQLGLGRAVAPAYAAGVLAIDDVTPLARRIDELRRAGEWEAARRLLPEERPYALPAAIAQHLGAD